MMKGKRMKKLVAAALAGTLALGVAACGHKTETDNVTTETNITDENTIGGVDTLNDSALGNDVTANAADLNTTDAGNAGVANAQ
jgi:ABC-type oligopeptide transport system substrate-binding subunit